MMLAMAVQVLLAVSRALPFITAQVVVVVLMAVKLHLTLGHQKP
jgi:hypothetical protein